MKNLKTTYMGLEMKNPLILGSSVFSSSLDDLKRAEDAGFGGVVLRSIFEEQITNKTNSELNAAEDYLTQPDAYNFLKSASSNYYIDKYMKLVSDANDALEIPVFASICCSSETGWLDYAKKFNSCGANAVEINYYLIPSDCKVTSAELEKKYISVFKKIRKSIELPLAVKLPWYFTALSNVAKEFSNAGTDGIVLFNHFGRPDIDVEKLCVSDKLVQPKGDYSESLRWTAIISSEIKTDICASTGVRDADTAIKMILAGAKTTQLVSAVQQGGYCVVKSILSDMESWMDRHGFESIDQFRGLLSQKKVANSQAWERDQYMKINQL